MKKDGIKGWLLESKEIVTFFSGTCRRTARRVET
jgi:hypothetical protein